MHVSFGFRGSRVVTSAMCQTGRPVFTGGNPALMIITMRAASPPKFTRYDTRTSRALNFGSIDLPWAFPGCCVGS